MINTFAQGSVVTNGCNEDGTQQTFNNDLAMSYQGSTLMRAESLIPNEDVAAAMVIPTETVYSWYYYEREDQIADLIESLNPKGQRERKL